jgi:hypothetical protein
MKAAIQSWLRPVALALSCGLLYAAADGQWNKKPPSSWSRGDTLRLLTDSPWARTQSITTVDDRANRPSVTPSLNRPDLELSPGEIRFRIRLITAKPVREALGRYADQIEDERGRYEIRDLSEMLASEDHGDLVIVMVTFDTVAVNSQVDEIQAALETGDTEKLKPETSLELQGKPVKEIELQEYKSWGRRSGLFKFPRTLDGKPWLSGEVAEFRFRTKLGKSAPVVATFKTKEMMYAGSLEY